MILPVELARQAIHDPTARAVLADWLEEHPDWWFPGCNPVMLFWSRDTTLHVLRMGLPGYSSRCEDICGHMLLTLSNQ